MKVRRNIPILLILFISISINLKAFNRMFLPDWDVAYLHSQNMNGMDFNLSYNFIDFSGKDIFKLKFLNIGAYCSDLQNLSNTKHNFKLLDMYFFNKKNKYYNTFGNLTVLDYSHNYLIQSEFNIINSELFYGLTKTKTNGSEDAIFIGPFVGLGAFSSRYQIDRLNSTGLSAVKMKYSTGALIYYYNNLFNVTTKAKISNVFYDFGFLEYNLAFNCDLNLNKLFKYNDKNAYNELYLTLGLDYLKIDSKNVVKDNFAFKTGFRYYLKEKKPSINEIDDDVEY